MIWRVVLDGRIPDGLTEIRQGWTLDDLCHAHDFLDELDRIAEAARARAEAEVRAAQARRGH